MDTTGSFIYTVLENVRAILDDADLDAKYNDSYVVRNLIGPAMADVLSRVNLTADNIVLCKFVVSLVDGQEYYQLPPIIGEVCRVCAFDTNGILTWDWRPRNEMHPWGPGWAIDGNTLRIRPFPTQAQDIEVWYIPNSSMLPHYGTGAAYDLAGKIASHTVANPSVITDEDHGLDNGDTITVVGSNSTPTLTGSRVATVIDEDTFSVPVNVTVAAQGSWYRTTPAPTVIENGFFQLASTPTLGLLDRREDAYTGYVLRVLEATGVWQERVITSYDPVSRMCELRRPLLNLASTSPLYEVAPPFQSGLWQAVSLWAAAGLGTYKNIPQSKAQAILLRYNSAIKTIRDNWSNMQQRTGKQFKRNTIDNEAYMDTYPIGGYLG